ncbi:MAG TPA: hypothetical protein VK622_12385 [Puia sp.]|nr:hypothetical protein [Puia sp.]
MPLKLKDLTQEQVVKIVTEYGMEPAFNGQNLYIASSPGHEILAGLMSNGLYQVELLDKNEIEQYLHQTIRIYKEFVDASKS